MNNDFEHEDSAPDEHNGAPRPLGYWLRLVDGLISREFAAAFEGEGVTRREWMLLNALSGDVDAPGLADRLARKGGKRLRRLERLGWAEEQGDGTWALTDAGREARERLGEAVSGIRSRIAGAVSPDDYATTLASLEAIARSLDWDESQPFPRGRGFGRARFGGGSGRGRFGGPRPFGSDFGYGAHRHGGFAHPSEGDGCHGHESAHGSLHDRSPCEHFGHAGHGHAGHGHHSRGHHSHGHHGHRHGGHGQRGHGGGDGHGAGEVGRAYEAGFAAGFGAARAGSDAERHAPDAA